MGRTIFSILMIVAGIAIIIAFVNPRYQLIKEQQVEERELNAALVNARQLQELRDDLRAKFDSFSPAELRRLETLVPDDFNSVELILEINNLIQTHALSLQNIQVNDVADSGGSVALDASGLDYGTALVEFSAIGTYENFVTFVESLERSLRLLDIVDLSFRSTDTSIYQYSISMNTY